VDRKIANCCLVTDRFRAPDKRGEAKTIARQTCFRINRLLPVPYPAGVNCPLRDGFPHRTGAVLHIRQTKSRRERCLPLTDRVGRALSEYLQDGRPRSIAREVFLRHAFPVGMPLKAETVRGAMREAYLRAGLGSSCAGTHILRRTFATRLHQHGVTLKSIADLLGHQCPDTTTAYTRINLKELRRVALPWPK
jgi:site-specific recombinase XerD